MSDATERFSDAIDRRNDEGNRNFLRSEVERLKSENRELRRQLEDERQRRRALLGRDGEAD